MNDFEPLVLWAIPALLIFGPISGLIYRAKGGEFQAEDTEDRTEQVAERERFRRSWLGLRTMTMIATQRCACSDGGSQTIAANGSGSTS